jgi:hypothetical protein
VSFLPLGMITVVRLILRFGAAFEIDPDCGRLKAILSDMTFQKGIARTDTLTARQCEDVIPCAGRIDGQHDHPENPDSPAAFLESYRDRYAHA